MSWFTHSPVLPPLVKRRLAVAGVLAAALAAAPPAPALAQGGSTSPAHQARAARRADTLEQRIAALHAALKITPAQETEWQAVAQTMRDNAAALERLAADKAAGSRQGMTALEDMQAYKQFAQAHVDGLNNLIASFTTLYTAMPDDQKRLADEVFRKARRRDGTAGG